MTPTGASSASAERPVTEMPTAYEPDRDPLCQCQGCGAWRGISWLGKGHACWRNEDGTYEEGGTFQ